MLYEVITDTQLTIYNQDFAAVKETRTLTLPKGESEARVADITAHLEPDSVVLRDLSDPDGIRILEQNYESDPLSEGLVITSYSIHYTKLYECARSAAGTPGPQSRLAVSRLISLARADLGL